MANLIDQDQLRTVSRVARLYYSYDLKQTQIAKKLEISQARVSRLLSMADDLGVVRTMFVAPRGIHPDLEFEVEDKYKLHQVHIVDGLSDPAVEPFEQLGQAAAAVLESMPLEDKNIGFTAWSRSLRETAKSLGRAAKYSSSNAIELLGDVGSPQVQHEATMATETFSKAIGAQPVFLRLPSVVSSRALLNSLVDNDAHASLALSLMERLDVALLGLGGVDLASPQYAGANFFNEEQLRVAIGKGAVGQVNLRFIDANGEPVKTELDDLVIGIKRDQILQTEIRIAAAAGVSKWAAIKAAVKGGWINVLVTDRSTAEFLLQSHA
ncbi:MAG: sugar-binding transcriptional regulator [Micrococcales bacterium]